MNTYTEDELRAALANEGDVGSPPMDVWPRLHRGIVVRRRVRAGAAAAALGVVAAVVVVALPKQHDSATVVPGVHTETTLMPKRPLSDAQLRASVDTLRQRLDSLGASGVQLSTHDGAIDVSGSRLSKTEIGSVATRGVLQFRSIDLIEPASTCPSPTGEAPPTDGAVACGTDGTTRYTLGPVALNNSDVQTAYVVQDAISNSWLVFIDFDRAGADKFHTLTAGAGGQPGGTCETPHDCNSIAILVDGTVVSAPSVQPRAGIEGGQSQIAGNFTREQARTIAAFAKTTPLLTAFSVS